jgi:hypothetical protein
MNLGDFAGLQTRAMTEIVRRFPRQQHIGQAILPVRPSATKSVYWDILEGSRKLAKFTAPGSSSHISGLMPRSRVNTEVLFMKEKKTVDENTKNFISRPGTFDDAYGTQLITDELEELNTMVENTKEWMVWQAIVNGKIDIRQADPSVFIKVDYAFLETHKPTADALWSVTASAKPLSDILTWKRLISRDAQVAPTDAYLTSLVMQYLVENSSVQTLLQYTVGNQLAANGVITRLAGLDLTQYEASYVDDNGDVQYFVPDTKFVIVAKPGLGKAFTGPIDVPEGEGVRTVIGKTSYSWSTKDPVDTWMLVGDSYMPAIQNPDQIVSATIN